MLLLALVAGLSMQDKKGLQVQMVDDALALGVRQAAINVSIGDWVTEKPTAWPIPESGLYLRDGTMQALRSQVHPFSSKGIRVFLILLARETGNPAVDSALLHPKYDRAAPNKLSAFNVVTSSGRALLGGFASAATQALGKGAVSGWIVGNEINSHWYWANQGKATLDEVADSTERALRIVHESSIESVYLSLEHHWNIRYGSDPGEAVPGRLLLDNIARLARERGDFGWRIAFHPYPENLFNPRFWEDKTAPLSADAPRVTFRNLEVLTEYLKKRELRWKGKPRVVNLTEQGFHRPDGPDGDLIQAAAYAYAWNRVKRNPGIEGLILHRHVDHAHEGGLRLGLWENVPGSTADPGRRTRMWEVFEACGTNREEAATAFALPIVGLKSWAESGPKRVQN